MAVELERSGATISGMRVVGDAAEVEFFGWIGLIDGLERAVQELGPGDMLAVEDGR